MSRWTPIAKDFNELIGYTFLGDIFLRNSKTGQFAILFTINPELIALNVHSISDFRNSFLSHPDAKRTIIQNEKVDELKKRLGDLVDDEIYIPIPFPFLGGDRSIESYKKGKIFTYLDLVGGLQGLE